MAKIFTNKKIKHALASDQRDINNLIGLIREHVCKILQKTAEVKNIQEACEKHSMEVVRKLRQEVQILHGVAEKDLFYTNQYLKKLCETFELIRAAKEDAQILKHWDLLNHWTTSANLVRTQPAESCNCIEK